MSEPTPREALTRLVRSVMKSEPDVSWPASIDTAEGLEAVLDTDEASDYAAVMEALGRRPRYAYVPVRLAENGTHVHRSFLLDLDAVEHGHHEAAVVARVDSEQQGKAFAYLLNHHPEAWDEACAATGDEPF